MSAYEFYLVEKNPPVAWVYLNPPDKLNAMHQPAWAESIPIFADLDADEDIKVVIIAGKGRCFSAGIDLIGMAAFTPELLDKDQKGATKWKFLPKIQAMQETMSCIERCRKPVIAAVHGYCIGAGLDMITACDIRLCSQDATFSLREAAVGFVADVGVLQRIPLDGWTGDGRGTCLYGKKHRCKAREGDFTGQRGVRISRSSHGGRSQDGHGNCGKVSLGGAGIKNGAELWCRQKHRRRTRPRQVVKRQHNTIE